MQKFENNIGNGSTKTQSESDDETFCQNDKNETLIRKDNLVKISCFETSSNSKDVAIVNIIQLAKQMGLKLTRKQIGHVAVFQRNLKYVDYFVFFGSKQIKHAFLEKKLLLKNFPDTTDLVIKDEMKHSPIMIRFTKPSDPCKGTAFANVIGLATELGLPLTRDDIKTLHLCREDRDYFYYYVEFYTTKMRNAYLEKIHHLK